MSNETDSTGNPLAVASTSSDLLLIIFIHGFKGDDDTFSKFPQRLHHILTETIPSCEVECVVFPAYETKGELNEAVTRFADWLTTLTVEKEVAHGGAGKAKIVLCGHSMGGLLAADSLLEFVNSRPDKSAPVWPNIVGCIAFDTPYLGLHPFVFKNSATKAIQYANSARVVGSAVLGSLAGWGAKKATTPTTETPPVPTSQDKPGTPPASASPGPPPAQNQSKSPWGKWAPAAYAIGGAVAAGAAGGVAYWRKDDLGMGYNWVTDHFKYVGNLWDEDELKKRLDAVIAVEKTHGILFRVYYTLLPAVPLLHDKDRSFVMLPKPNAPEILAHFLPAVNNTAPDELHAHTGMFGANTNDGYYKLGLDTAGLIREAMMMRRGVVDPEVNKKVVEEAAESDPHKNSKSSMKVDSSVGTSDLDMQQE